ncbi:hypothetical protein AVEN_261204-1, partial [Araneus ventricosus]
LNPSVMEPRHCHEAIPIRRIFHGIGSRNLNPPVMEPRHCHEDTAISNATNGVNSCPHDTSQILRAN